MKTRAGIFVAITVFALMFMLSSCNPKHDDPKPVLTGTMSTAATYAAVTHSLSVELTIAQTAGLKSASFGVCLSKNPTPTVSDNNYETEILNMTSQSVVRDHVFDGLDNNTTYYLRSYIKVNGELTYFGVLTITTTAPADAITLDATSITMNDAVLNGTVNPNNLSTTVTFEYGETPSLGQSISVGTYSGNTVTPVNIKLSSLTPGKTYYFALKASNQAGTTMGNQMKVWMCSVKDVDGGYYHTIVIGTQTWMVENLNVTHYNDGTAIPNVTDTPTWNALTTGAYCYYKNDKATYAATYGALYNQHAVATKKLAPVGYHVPSMDEWFTLENFIGGETFGGTLKEAGYAHWSAPNVGATNSSGYTALPGGGRDVSATGFNDVNLTSYFWSSSERTSSDAWASILESSHQKLLANISFLKGIGFSVRCLKD